MTIRIPIECSICHTKYILRCQCDHVMNMGEAPIRVGCKNCRKIIRGKIGAEKYSFEEEQIVNSDSLFDPAESIGVSTELPITKGLYYQPTSIALLGPYMELLSYFDQTKIKNHSLRINSLVNDLIPSLPKIENLYNVSKSGNISAFNQYAEKEFSMKREENVTSDLEMIDGVINLIGHVFSVIKSKEYQVKYTNACILPLMDTLSNTSTQTLKLMRTEIETKVLLENEVSTGINLCINFLKRITSLYPLMLLLENEDFTEEHNGELFLSTTEYGEIKTLFADNFEFLSRMSILIVGLQNIKDRNDYNQFPTSCDFAKYVEMDNGLKNKQIPNYPNLDKYYLRTLDNQIRNGINHVKTDYDSFTQIIKYYPFAKRPTDFLQISLIDFSFIILQQNIKVYESLCVLADFLSKTK